MSTKIYCDIADINQIKKFSKKKLVKGFTTNPSLMRKAGAKNYEKYSKEILKVCKKHFCSLKYFYLNDHKAYQKYLNFCSFFRLLLKNLKTHLN